MYPPMLSKWRTSSISTVHFKRQLSFPPFPSPSSHTQTLKINDPFYQTRSPLPLSRLRTESTHFKNPHSPHFWFSHALKVIAKMGSFHEAKQIHAHLVKLGFYNVLSLQNRLLNVYVKSKDFFDAQTLFDEMRVRNVVTWNILICGVVVDFGSNNKSNLYLGFCYFKRMLLDEVGFDHITFNGLFRACIEVNDIGFGRQLHCGIVKLGFDLDCFVGSSLVDLYAKCGLVEDARRAFDIVLNRDLVLWNVMVSCYGLNCLVEEGFKVFNLMRLQGLKGDEFTFSSLLNSCGSLGSCELGRQVHCLIIKQSFDLDILVASALVDMYAKNVTIDDARKAFDGMVVRNNVSWTTMIVGYGQHGDGKEAVRLLRDMFQGNFYPDELNLASILSSCGNISATFEIMQVHAYLLKNGFQAFLSIANALINAYSKCGTISGALQCFRSVTEPDIVTWTSIIGAYAFHGLSKESIELFEHILSNGVRPDEISFLGVLSACNHGGLVSEGLHYFNLMINDYQIMPNDEHYTCVIDLLGRAGLLDEAFNVLMSMPVEPRSTTLGAFIRACKVHGNAGLAKWAADKLFALEPNKAVNYTLMSNMYASEGRWSDVVRIRKMMRDRCDYKIPGCSWTEIAVDIHTFA